MTTERSPWPDDEALVEAVISGNKEAWEALYERCKRTVNRIAWKFTRHEENAKDLCQEIWLHVFLVLPRWQPIGSLDAWITTVATNRALIWFRRHTRQYNEEMAEELYRTLQELPKSATDPARMVEQRAMQEALWCCLEGVKNVSYRRALQLMMQQYSYEAIAQILSVPLGTVGTWISRGKREMKKCLEEKLPDLFSPESRSQ